MFNKNDIKHETRNTLLNILVIAFACIGFLFTAFIVCSIIKSEIDDYVDSRVDKWARKHSETNLCETNITFQTNEYKEFDSNGNLTLYQKVPSEYISSNC